MHMIGALIQARMSSMRLPNKVLKEINGRPMLSYMIERVRASKYVDTIVVITSTDPSDDVLEEFCKAENIDVYRGSLDDVVDRYYQAAKHYGIDIIVRLTGDCPLIDPDIINTIVKVYIDNSYDYVTNAIPQGRTAPDGMDVEVFSFTDLEEVWREAKKVSEREHVTFRFWQNPDKYSVYQYSLNQDLSHYRMVVDYPSDFEVVTQIFQHLYGKGKIFSMNDIIAFLQTRPDIGALNQAIQPNQGWQSSFEKDKKAGFTS